MTAGASLAEINEGMSKLLDNQVDTQNENLKINIPGFMQALVKGCDENKELKEEENDHCIKNFVMKGLYI